MSKVYPRDSFVFPSLTKLVFVVEQRKLFDDVIHDQVNVDCWLFTNHLFVGFAKLAHMRYVESLVRIELKHSSHNSFELG